MSAAAGRCNPDLALPLVAASTTQAKVTEMTNLPPPRLAEHEIAVAGLDPRHDGVRIAQLSDIHVGNLTPETHVRAAIDATNAAGADVVVLTGDYVCWRRREALDAESQLAGLRAERVVAVLGNHDYMTWGAGVTTALTRNGYDVLKNQSSTVELRGAKLEFVGIDDPVTRHHDLDRAFHQVDPKATRIALCHTPSLAVKVAERGAALVLSGHTHGGQIFVPGITDRIMRSIGLHYRTGRYDLLGDPARAARPRRSGDAVVVPAPRPGVAASGATLYVTPGIGFSGVTKRAGHGTEAEVAVFTLRAAPATDAAPPPSSDR
jgi:uncharacterized protein